MISTELATIFSCLFMQTTDIKGTYVGVATVGFWMRSRGGGGGGRSHARITADLAVFLCIEFPLKTMRLFA